MLMNTAEYISIIENIKSEITAAQYRAAVHVNADMLLLYYDIGCVINEHKSWGNKFIDNLAADIRIAFPESKGYSVRNLKYMAKLPRRIQIGNCAGGVCTNSVVSYIAIWKSQRPATA